MAGIDAIEDAGGGIQGQGNQRDEGPRAGIFVEVFVQRVGSLKEGISAAHVRVDHRVNAGGDQGGGQALPAHIGDGQQPRPSRMGTTSTKSPPTQ